MSIGDFPESLSQAMLVGCNVSRRIGRIWGLDYIFTNFNFNEAIEFQPRCSPLWQEAFQTIKLLFLKCILGEIIAMKESNLMHGINGLLYGNLKGLVANSETKASITVR